MTRIQLSRASTAIASLVACILSCCWVVSISYAAEGDLELNAATAVQRKGDLEQSKQMFEAIVAKYPKSVVAGNALCSISEIQLALKQDKEAMAVLDRVIADAVSPAVVARATIGKIGVYTNWTREYDKAIESADQFLAAADANLIPEITRAQVLNNLVFACIRSDQPEKGLVACTKYTADMPGILTINGYFDRMLELQLKAGRADEALSTARLCYATCDFNQEAIEKAGDLVRRAFAGRGDVSKAMQFVACQANPEAPNPLRAVPLPPMTDQQLQKYLDVYRTTGSFRVRAYLCAGKYKEAMMEATTAVGSVPMEQMTAALQEVARVLKAYDLNLVRANAFLTYAKTGEGENPVDKFMEEVK